MVREKLVKAFEEGVVTTAGLIAHGRGECFDYIIGEKTRSFAFKAEKTAVAALLLADHPVISLNGNATALAVKEFIELARLVNAKIEVNLFYKSFRRIKTIARTLEENGWTEVYGVNKNVCATIPEISSLRCEVDSRGLYIADTVLLSIEDGDRTIVFRKMGKNVIAIDLNPFSRTSLWASITIVDNIIRAVPNMVSIAKTLRSEDKPRLKEILEDYSNTETLKEAVSLINSRLGLFALKGTFDLNVLENDGEKAYLNGR